MEFNEFIIKSKRTCNSLGSFPKDISHFALGVSSEIEEFLTSTDSVNATEELGDLLFYVANYMNLRNISYEDLSNPASVGSSFTERLQIGASLLCDVAKRVLAYGADINSMKDKELKALGFCVFTCIDLCEIYDVKFSYVLEKNYKKLLVRYPIETGFTKELALNRNLEAERKSLEE